MATWLLAYLGGWAVTTAVAVVAARTMAPRFSCGGGSFALSVLAGAVWPLMLLGALEFASVAMWSTVRSWRKPVEIPESWLMRTPERVLVLH